MSLKDNILHYLLDSKFCLVKFSWESLERILLISCFVQMAHHLDFALSSHKTSNMEQYRCFLCNLKFQIETGYIYQGKLLGHPLFLHNPSESQKFYPH